jgi:hypothetical protein
MKTKFLIPAATIFGASLFSINAWADTVAYMQASNAGFGDTSAMQNFPGDLGFTRGSDSDMQAWAYFKAPADASFNRINWNGSSADGNFAVDFFSATCFSCGATLVGTDGTTTHTAAPENSLSLLPNAGPFEQLQVHKSFVSGNEYSYFVDLSASVSLKKDTFYGLSVVNNFTSAPFQWSSSSADNGLSGSYHGIGFSGNHLNYVERRHSFLPAQGNLAFTLSSVSAVPEPETYTMLLAGLGLIGATVKRRKDKQA